MRSPFAASPAAPARRVVERAPSLSHEEKEALSKAIEELPAESMGEVFRIMHMDAREGEEVEVDLNSLPLSTLRRLQSFVERVGTSRHAVQHLGVTSRFRVCPVTAHACQTRAETQAPA